MQEKTSTKVIPYFSKYLGYKINQLFIRCMTFSTISTHLNFHYQETLYIAKTAQYIPDIES